MSQPRDFDVIGMGHALVDLEVEVDQEFLTSQEVEKGHRRLVTSREKADLHKALGRRSVHRCSGGSVANTVVGVAGLGGSGGFFGKVGLDEEGVFFRKDLERLEIPLLSKAGPGHTGTCTVMITHDAQRTMMTHLGISADLGPEDIEQDAVSRAKYLLVEGYLLPHERTLEAALEAISMAKKSGVKVALAVSDPFVIKNCRDLLWELIEGPVDLLFLNDLEGWVLTGLDDPLECAREIHRHSADVALTLGPEGSVLLNEGESSVIQVVPVEAVDTTGAGDMYAAGLLYGLTQGWSWPRAGRLGSHVASRLISAMGSRLLQPLTEKEMKKLAADCE
jgi:sugar/nucleoside kinase (ribokinase family)